MSKPKSNAAGSVEQSSELEVYGEDLGREAARLMPHQLRRCRDACAWMNGYLHSGARRLLDIGCGSGGSLEVARSAGWDSEGLEPDDSAAAQRRLMGFTVHRGSLDEVTLEPKSYDVVTFHHGLEHVERPIAELRRVAGVVQPGGCIFLERRACARQESAPQMEARQWRGRRGYEATN